VVVVEAGGVTGVVEVAGVEVVDDVVELEAGAAVELVPVAAGCAPLVEVPAEGAVVAAGAVVAVELLGVLVATAVGVVELVDVAGLVVSALATAGTSKSEAPLNAMAIARSLYLIFVDIRE
jgi:hypothetical protein